MRVRLYAYVLLCEPGARTVGLCRYSQLAARFVRRDTLVNIRVGGLSCPITVHAAKRRDSHKS